MTIKKDYATRARKTENVKPMATYKKQPNFTKDILILGAATAATAVLTMYTCTKIK